MEIRPHAADEGPFTFLERWSPEAGEAWTRWREALSATPRARSLVPLQAVLSGLAALRVGSAEDNARMAVPSRAARHAELAACRWARSLARDLYLGASGAQEPERSLHALVVVLDDAVEHGDGALELVHDELASNPFFRPAAPLEFCNVEELVGTEHGAAEVHWEHITSEETAAVVAFFALLRSHRFLVAADREVHCEEGFLRAYVVVAGVVRELRAIARFVRVQVDDAFPNADASTEAIAEHVDLAVEAMRLDRLLSDLEDLPLAACGERLRNGIHALQAVTKDAARRVRDLAAPENARRGLPESMRVPTDLSQDLWAFGIILRAFLAKAEAVGARAEAWSDAERLRFAPEFARHYRRFGPRLAKATEYARTGPLTAAVSVLSNPHAIDAARLGLAARECERFAAHLDGARGSSRSGARSHFDKERAADELRAYLAASRQRVASPAAAGAFGPRRRR